MYPHERSLVKRLADKPFAIVGVNSDRDLKSIQGIVKEKNISWRSFWNGEKGTRGPISTKWRVQGWPTTYLIDKDGVIRYSNVRGDKLDEAIEELMAEMGHEVKLVGVDHEAEDAAEDKKAESSEDAAAETEKADASKSDEKADSESDAKSDKAESATEDKAESGSEPKVEKKADSSENTKEASKEKVAKEPETKPAPTTEAGEKGAKAESSTAEKSDAPAEPKEAAESADLGKAPEKAKDSKK